MEHKRSVVAAAAASTVLVVASTAFAATSIFGSHGSDKIGSFEPIEQVLQPAPVPRVSGSRSAAATNTTTDTTVAREDSTDVRGHPLSQSAGAQAQPETPSTVPEPMEAQVEHHDETSNSTRPETESQRSEGASTSTTSTTVGNVPTTDDGRGSDD